MTRFVLAAAWLLFAIVGCSHPLKPDPADLAAASPELLQRLRADPYNYFRFVNHEWAARVCDIFEADLRTQPIVQLHGDAHLEQYAYMDDAWGLDDFDDSARGPALVDIVRFLGSIDLAARRRGWTASRDRLFDEFFAGYRRGLSEEAYQPPQPEIVRWLMTRYPTPTREQFLASAEAQMGPMDDIPMQGAIGAMEAFTKVVQRERPDLPDEYFRVVRAGSLHMGIGSAATRKILIRVRGPSDDPADDVVLEAKALRSLDGIHCLEVPKTRPTFRVIAGSQQLGRLMHNILVAGPDVDVPEMAAQGEHLRNWWIRSWEPSYREITLDDLRSVDDLSALVYDSAVQLGAGTTHAATGSARTSLRSRSLASMAVLEPRLRAEAGGLVHDLLRGWQELATR